MKINVCLGGGLNTADTEARRLMRDLAIFKHHNGFIKLPAVCVMIKISCQTFNKIHKTATCPLGIWMFVGGDAAADK